MKTVAQALSDALIAKRNCERSGNEKWLTHWTLTVGDIVRGFLPRGAGFDSGTELLSDKADSRRLAFRAGYHRMTGDGYYDGWHCFDIDIYPTFGGLDVIVKDAEDGVWLPSDEEMREYVGETFHDALSQSYPGLAVTA